MKILIVYLYCTQGGVETAIKNRIKKINLMDNKIDLLFMYDCGGKAVFDDLSINLYIENNSEKIKKIIIQNNYDIVISFDTFEIVQLLKKMNYKGKVGLEVHTTYKDSLVYLKDIKEGMIDYVSVPSEYEKGLVEQMLKIKVPILILPNSLDFSVFGQIFFEKRNERPILVYVGRIDSHKNWRLFLDIAREVNIHTNKRFEIWIVGGLRSEKKEIEAMQNKILEYDMVSCFRWIPYLRYKEMSRMYSYVGQSGGGLLITSQNESFGMTILEAMACKCPVVANDVGAVNELLKNGKYGCLINEKKEDEKKMAYNIIKFLDTQVSKGLMEEAYQAADADFSVKSVGRKFLKQIENVIETKK